MFKYFSFTRLVRYFFLSLSHLPVRGHHRWIFLKWGGVNFASKYPHVCIYKQVSIDTVAPELLFIGDRVTITEGVKILTHYLDPSRTGRHFRLGEVHIKNDVFIGMNVIICNSVTIGEGAVIGAGSIVTKNIPPYQIWAGNPAKYIKDRIH